MEFILEDLLLMSQFSNIDNYKEKDNESLEIIIILKKKRETA